MPKSVLKEELIGQEMTVVDADNPSLVGIRGTIVDETKNTLVVENGKGTKTLIKNQIRFTVKKDGKRIEIDGKKISQRPEKRLTK